MMAKEVLFCNSLHQTKVMQLLTRIYLTQIRLRCRSFSFGKTTMPVRGISFLKFVANEHNFKNVGELPLSEQVAAMTGEDQRFWKIYMFCDPLTAAKMVDYSDAFSAYLPCRIAPWRSNSIRFVGPSHPSR